MLIDTHCHLTFDGLVQQVDPVLDRAAQSGVSRVITVATSPGDAQTALSIMSRRREVYLSAGIHPHAAGACTPSDLQALADLHRQAARLRASSASTYAAAQPGRGATAAPQAPGGAAATSGAGAAAWAGQAPAAEGTDPLSRLVAVGETGLDFYYSFAPAERQEEVFRFQLDLAREVGLPVVIHARQSEARVCEVLSEYPDLAGRVVFHCFSADAALARRILDLGYWLSFTGVVTFRNATGVQEAARLVPADRFLVETDAPYLSPEPLRGRRPNEPAWVVHTARFLAELRGQPFEELAETTTRNARRFFGLSD